MKLCWLLIGDGRDSYHEQSFASAQEALPTPDAVVKVDDREHKLGFAGAIAEGWRQVLETGAELCFHIEADFIFNAPVDVERMAASLGAHKYLAQIALKRQAWNDEERAAGGIVEANPKDFTQVTEHGNVWTEHRRYWTTTPSLYPTNWCAQGWPQEEHSEGVFTHRLLQDPALRFGIWGAKFDPPAVTHIGEERAGVGY